MRCTKEKAKIAGCIVVFLMCVLIMIQSGVSVDSSLNASEISYQKTLEDCNKLIKTDPHSMDAWLKKLDLLLQREDYNELNKSLNEMVDLNPTSGYLALQGELLIAMGNYSLAQNALNKSLEINPENAVAWWLKGFVLADPVSLADPVLFSSSLACFDKAIEINPDYADAWAAKGSILKYIKKDDESNICLSKALKLYNTPISDPDKGYACNRKHIFIDKLEVTNEEKGPVKE